MTSHSPSRRQIIKWAVSSFVLAQAAPLSRVLDAATEATQLRSQTWPSLTIEQQASALFSRQVPVGALLLTSTESVGVVAAVFEKATENSDVREVTRWLCIASELSPGSHSIQVTADAMATSTSFHPVDVSLAILESGAIEVSEQHVRAHDKHTWTQLDGKWCLAKKSFAGNVAHQYVTHDYDMATEQFTSTCSLIDSDDVLAMEYTSARALIELESYCNGQALA